MDNFTAAAEEEKARIAHEKAKFDGYHARTHARTNVKMMNREYAPGQKRLLHEVS